VLPAITRTSLVLFIACVAQAQSVDKSLTFEVASVKPAAPPSANGRGMIMFRPPSGGPGTKDPGRINYPFISLKMLLTEAYNVKNYQIAGPSWLDTERFDINATMPPETTKEQFRVMLQNLLAERFKLAIHRETKELPTYVLTVGKGGPKMKEPAPVTTAADSDPALPPPLPPGPPTMGPDGFPTMPMGGRAGMFMMMMPGRARIVAQRQTMQDLANRLTGELNRPVMDATGLTAKYDFTLTFVPEGMGGRMGPPVGPMGPSIGAVPVAPPAPGGPGMDQAAGGENLPTLFGALTQLGLKLDAKKDQVEMIVVDHVEKTPTEN
jgi:uncharacterized protein (TIGR03435 family)